MPAVAKRRFLKCSPGGFEGSHRYEGGSGVLGLRREGATVPTRMSKWIGPALLMGSLAAVTGCVQGPDYERPQVAVPDDFRFQDATASFEADTGVWWQAFGDPTIDALVHEALVSNRDLRIASARVDEAAAIVTGTRSQGLL